MSPSVSDADQAARSSTTSAICRRHGRARPSRRGACRRRGRCRRRGESRHELHRAAAQASRRRRFPTARRRRRPPPSRPSRRGRRDVVAHARAEADEGILADPGAAADDRPGTDVDEAPITTSCSTMAPRVDDRVRADARAGVHDRAGQHDAPSPTLALGETQAAVVDDRRPAGGGPDTAGRRRERPAPPSDPATPRTHHGRRSASIRSSRSAKSASSRGARRRAAPGSATPVPGRRPRRRSSVRPCPRSLDDDPGVLAAADDHERAAASPLDRDRRLARRAGRPPCRDDTRDPRPGPAVANERMARRHARPEGGIERACAARPRRPRRRAGTSMTFASRRRPSWRSPTLTAGRSTAGASISALELLPSIASAIRRRPQ